MGSTYLISLESYSDVTVPKIVEISWHSTKLLQKQKGYQFFETQCIFSNILYKMYLPFIGECVWFQRYTSDVWKRRRFLAVATANALFVTTDDDDDYDGDDEKIMELDCVY